MLAPVCVVHFSQPREIMIIVRKQHNDFLVAEQRPQIM